MYVAITSAAISDFSSTDYINLILESPILCKLLLPFFKPKFVYMSKVKNIKCLHVGKFIYG